MKLSANAREFVSLSVKGKFAADLKEAVANVEKVRGEQEAAYRKFEGELDRMLAAWTKEVMALVKRHGLTWRKGYGPDKGAHLRVFADEGRYSDICDGGFFNETYDGNDRVSAAKEAVSGIESKIVKATGKALFEIEVHGKKDTLEQIVADVIRQIKEER